MPGDISEYLGGLGQGASQVSRIYGHSHVHSKQSVLTFSTNAFGKAAWRRLEGIVSTSESLESGSQLSGYGQTLGLSELSFL